MHNLRRYYVIFLFCISASGFFAYGQQLQVATDVQGDSIHSTVFRKLLECNGARVYVTDNPKYQQEGIEVYPSAFDQLIFIERTRTIYCATIGFGWHLDGFVHGALNSAPDKSLLLFKISGEGIDRYFDVRGKKEVYPVPGTTSTIVVSDSVPEPPGKAVKVVKSWSGRDSRIAQTEYKRILSTDEWRQFWRRHDRKNDPPPEVDFIKNMVVTICLGRAYNTSGVEVADAREIDDVIQVRFRYVCYQTMDKVDTATPFGIFVLPRSSKKIQLEAKIQRLIGGPANWKSVAEFEKLK